MAKNFGTYNPDGSIESYPTHDINGAEIVGKPGTLYRVGDRFAVLPPNFNDQEKLDKWAEQYGQAEPPTNTLISGSKTKPESKKDNADA